MNFTWDEAKRQSNRVKHGLDFARAPQVFASETFTTPDERFAYDEARFITIGWLDATLVVIAHTEIHNMIRIISMRRATSHERRIYTENTRGNSC